MNKGTRFSINENLWEKGEINRCGFGAQCMSSCSMWLDVLGICGVVGIVNITR